MWRVVIIDDDDKVLKGMKKIIPWDDLECEWSGEAKNGKAGINLIREVKPDIVITDIYMPVMNGLEMIQEVREDGFESKIIILSGFSDFEYARQAMRLRIDDYLNKPASVTTVREVMKKLVEELEEEDSKKLEFTELREKIRLYEPLVQKEWIKSIVTGTVNVSSMPSQVLSAMEHWYDKVHVVIAITFDKSLEQSLLYQQDWYLFRFALGNIVKETTQTMFNECHYIELHSHQSVLCLNINQEESTNIREKLKTLRNRIGQRIQTYLHVRAKVEAGEIKQNWKSLADSTREAIAKTTKENNYFLLDMESMPVGEHLVPEFMELNQRLSEAIRYADDRKALQVIDEFFQEVSNQPFHRVEALRLGIEMWTIMTYSLHDVGIRIQDMFPKDFNSYYELSQNNSWSELSIYLKEKIQQICHHQQWDENLKHKQLIEQMIEYVQEHISENITLQNIADELYISRNYLGQIFKKVVGESYKNYITRVRMEKAKKMIQEGNNLIYEVAREVGYDNPAYFATTFKKFTGYTPSELINKRSLS